MSSCMLVLAIILLQQEGIIYIELRMTDLSFFAFEW